MHSIFSDPVFHTKARNAAEFTLVIGDKGNIQGKGVGRNQQVHRADNPTFAFKPSAYFSIGPCGGGIKIGLFQVGAEYIQGDLILFRRRTLPYPMFELRKGND